jgi:uncharacterized protein YecE (DUF72 family)
MSAESMKNFMAFAPRCGEHTRVTDQRQTAVPGLRVGCAGIPTGVSRAAVFDAVDVLEDSGLNREPAPSPKAMRRWRREAPDSAGFALVAPASIFEPRELGERALTRLRDAVAALSPEVLVLQPSLEHSPSQSNRDRLRDLAGADLAPEAELVFAPTGLWDPEICATLADELDLAVAIDPLASDVQDRLRPLWMRELTRGVAYLRLERLASARRRFDDYELDALVEMVEGLDRGWVIFGHEERLRDSRRLRQRLET